MIYETGLAVFDPNYQCYYSYLILSKLRGYKIPINVVASVIKTPQIRI